MSQDHRTPSHLEAETSAGKTPSSRPSLEDLASASPVVPETIAKYRIIKMIGQGGMGAVYLAEQENPRRTVALKVIKPGYVSRPLLRRFDLEAQVLGREHREVAKNLQELGLLREDQGRLDEALAAMQETLAVRRKALDEKNPDLARAMGENVRLLAILKRFDEAEPLAVERFQLSNRVFGPDDPRTRDAARALVELYEKWSQPEKAEPYRTATTKP